MAGDRQGRISVDVNPEFDQAELFRQVKAAANKLPALVLKPKILAKDVNAAIREVNRKKLVSLKVPVSLSVSQINTEIRKINASKRLVALKIPVQLTGKGFASLRKESAKAEREMANDRLGIVKGLNKQVVNLDKTTAQERKTLFSSVAQHEKQLSKTIETERLNMWKNATRRAKDEDKIRIKTIRDNDRLAKSITAVGGSAARGSRNVGKFAANFVLVRTAANIGRLSAVATTFGFIAEAIGAASAAAVELTAALSFASIGGLGVATSALLSYGQAYGVLKLSLSGVTDALGGLNEEADKDKLKALPPAAREFALELDALKPKIRGFQQILQENLFDGLSKSIGNLEPLVGSLVPHLTETADILGELANQGSRVIGTLGAPLQMVMAGNNIILRNLGIAAINLSEAFILIAAAVAPFSAAFSASVKSLAQAINLFIQLKSESGQLASFFAQAGAQLNVFLSLLGNVGRIIVNVFTAALPFGSHLLATLDGLSEKLADLTGSTKGLSDIRGFFKETQPAVSALGNLVVALAKAFFELASQPGLVILLDKIEKVLPGIVDAIERITSEFGPILVGLLGNLATLFANMSGELGPINTLAKILSGIIGTLNDFLENHPDAARVFLTIASGIAAIEIAAAAGGLALFIAQASGLARILGFAAVGGIRFGAALLGIQVSSGIAAGAMGRFARNAIGGIAPLVAALGPLGIALLAVGAAAVVAEAHIWDLGAAFAGSRGELNKFRDDWKEFSGKEINSLDAAKLKDLGVGAGGTRVGGNFIGPMAPPELLKEIKNRNKVREELAQSAKDFEDIFGTSKVMKDWKKNFKAIEDIGVPAAESIKEAIDPIKVAVDRMNDSLRVSRERLQEMGRAVDKQRGFVDKLKESIEALKNTQLQGTKAFDDQTFALNQQAKAIELELTNSKMLGISEEDPRIKNLQAQLESLQLQAQAVDLKKSLELDPLKKKLDETFNPIKELSFDQTVTQFKNLTAEHEKQSEKLLTLQKRYSSLDKSIQGMEATVAKIQANSSNISSGLSKAVSAPAVIEKPLKAAKVSLDASNQKLTEGVSLMRGNLTRPFKLAVKDINAILTSIPVRVAGAVTKLNAWAFHTGFLIGTQLIQGLMDGMRSFLAPGSPLHILLNKEIPKFIKENKGPVSFDQTILVPAGVAIMQGLTTGLRRGFEPVKGFLKDVGPSMEEFVPDSMFGKRTAEFLVDVAAGKKPDPSKFFADLVPDPVGLTGGTFDPRLAFLHKTLSLADTSFMAKSLAKTFGGGLQVTSLLRPGAITSSGNKSDHGFGLAADISNGNSPTPEMDSLAKALKPLFGTIVKQLIWRNKDQNKGFFVPGHMNHVHVAFEPDSKFSLNSGRIGKPFAPIFGNSKGSILKMIEFAAAAYGANPNLLKTIADRESSFDPKIFNNWDSNAKAGTPSAGLFQFIKATFTAFARQAREANKAAWRGVPMEWLNPLAQALAAAWAFTHGKAGHWTTAAGISPKDWFSKFGGFRAMGGPVTGGNSFIVGEKGPELFIPNRNGQVISNKEFREMAGILREIRDTGGLRQQTTNITTASRDPETVAALLEIKQRRKLRKLDLS